MQTELLKKIDLEIEKSRGALARDTIKLVRINSEKSAPQPGAPFGPGAKEVLDTVLEMGKEEGFYPVDYGMGVASISMKEGQPDLGIWLHGDVVPAGDGWIYPPYEGVEYEGCIIGRGATDNKGQLAAIFHIMKIFKDMGIELKYNTALYVGSNEETGMEDVKAFLKECQPPKLSLVPDSGFPLGYGGKGSVTLDFRSKEALHGLTITAGQADAPGKAVAELQGKTFETSSPPRHGSSPDPNGNMITKLTELLLADAATAEEDKPALRFFHDLSLDVDGKNIGIYVETNTMKPTTVFCKAVQTVDGYVSLTVNIRYPVEITGEEIVERLSVKAAASGMEVTNVRFGQKPYLMDPNHPIARKLTEVSNEVTGTDSKPFTLGGGTYAHWLPNAYVYGMNGNQVPAGFPAGHGGAHGMDEMVSLDRLQRAMRIYARALLALNEMEW